MRLGGLVLAMVALAAAPVSELRAEVESGDSVVVAAWSAQVTEKPRWLARPVTTATRGDRCQVVSSRGAWLEVVARDGHKGWLHSSNVVFGTALSGEATASDLEQEHRRLHPELDFSHVDAVLTSALDWKELAAFATAGKLKVAP